jgi:hypothetical protein
LAIVEMVAALSCKGERLDPDGEIVKVSPTGPSPVEINMGRLT